MKYKYSFFAIMAAFSPLVFSGGIELTPQPSFSGFYIGAGAGLSTLLTKDTFNTVRASGLGGDSGTNNYTNTSVLYAAQLGYGRVLQNKVYWGLEGSVTYAPLYTTDETNFSTASGNTLIVGNNTIRTTNEPIYNIDAVIGYAVYSNTLPFIELGVSFGEVERNYTVKRTRTNIATLANVKYQSNVQTGAYNTEYNVGVGVRRLFGSHCVASTSLMYTYLGENTGSSTVSIPNTTDQETHTRTVSSYALSILGTLSYLFS